MGLAYMAAFMWDFSGFSAVAQQYGLVRGIFRRFVWSIRDVIHSGVVATTNHVVADPADYRRQDRYGAVECGGGHVIEMGGCAGVGRRALVRCALRLDYLNVTIFSELVSKAWEGIILTSMNLTTWKP